MAAKRHPPIGIDQPPVRHIQSKEKQAEKSPKRAKTRNGNRREESVVLLTILLNFSLHHVATSAMSLALSSLKPANSRHLHLEPIKILIPPVQFAQIPPPPFFIVKLVLHFSPAPPFLSHFYPTHDSSHSRRLNPSPQLCTLSSTSPLFSWIPSRLSWLPSWRAFW